MAGDDGGAGPDARARVAEARDRLDRARRSGGTRAVAGPLRRPAPARDRLPDGVPDPGEPGRRPDRDARALARRRFSRRRRGPVRRAGRRLLEDADAVLAAGRWRRRHRRGGLGGVALSLLVVAGYANAIVLALLCALQISVIDIGQDFYAFGWEIQLVETGFLCVFLCPLLDGRPFPRRPAPRLVVWLLRWLIMRVMWGAGLIKLRGDTCWTDLSCLDFHFETQPIPSPLSPAFHFLPHGAHAAGVLFNHIVELGAPFLLFVPWRRVRFVGGALMAALQLVLIASGNLSFLNWLTLVPIAACFDDELWRRMLPRFARRARRTGAGRRRAVARARRHRGGAGRRDRVAQHRSGREHAVEQAADEHVVHAAAAGQHLRRVRKRRTRADAAGVRGNDRRGDHARDDMAARTNGSASPPIPHAGPAG